MAPLATVAIKIQQRLEDYPLHYIMGIVCSTDDADTGQKNNPTNPYNFPATENATTMEERNKTARLKRIEERAMKEAMRQSARAASQETVDNEGVFESSSDV